jgi:alpha-beta hydrolase superfamily lysophospholipase
VNSRVLALVALLCAACVHPPLERCPTCVIVDAQHKELPRIKPGAQRLFVLVPGVLGYGWEWDEAVQALMSAQRDDYLVFWWDPWGSVYKASHELRDTLGRALWTTPNSVREVVVIGHSMGGIVAAHAMSGLAVPPGRKLTVLTIGAPLAGMMGPPFYMDDALRSPAMMSVMGTFRDYPDVPPGVTMVEYVTSWPADPVMQPRYGHQVAPANIGPRGARRVMVSPKFDHNKIVSLVVLGFMRTDRPPEELKP